MSKACQCHETGLRAVSERDRHLNDYLLGFFPTYHLFVQVSVRTLCHVCSTKVVTTDAMIKHQHIKGKFILKSTIFTSVEWIDWGIYILTAFGHISCKGTKTMFTGISQTISCAVRMNCMVLVFSNYRRQNYPDPGHRVKQTNRALHIVQ